MTGIFMRVKRGERFVNLEIEYLTAKERIEILKSKEKMWLLSCIDCLCAEIAADGKPCDHPHAVETDAKCPTCGEPKS